MHAKFLLLQLKFLKRPSLSTRMYSKLHLVWLLLCFLYAFLVQQNRLNTLMFIFTFFFVVNFKEYCYNKRKNKIIIINVLLWQIFLNGACVCKSKYICKHEVERKFFQKNDGFGKKSNI